MLSSAVLNIIITYLCLATFDRYVNTLPITSKPIEGTAEHLAWQAWLMLPPEQKNLEKSRKVTPKSIFTLPFRQCPNGHQLFENRCIPTVNIDQTDLITQQLLGFVIGDDNNGNNNYEFDYDAIDVDDVANLMYDPMQKPNGNGNGQDSFHYDQLPSQDEPLKFNIFQQKFPTDYEADSILSDELEEQRVQPISNDTVSASDSETKETNLNATEINKSSTVDLQMESSNISQNVAMLNGLVPQKPDGILTSSSSSSSLSSPSSTEFFMSDIDAIILPAMPTQDSDTSLESETSKQNIHKISIFKDDSSVQLVTSMLLAERDNEKQKQPDLSQLLKADDLLPLPNIAATTETVTSNTDNVRSLAKTTKTTTTTTTPTTKSSFSTFNNDEVSILTTFNGIDVTTPLSGNNAEYVGEGTDMMLSDVDATLPTLSIENVKKVTPLRDSVYSVLKKGEHTRSVTSLNLTSGLTEPQEEKFTTTTEPDITTNFQVDETTVNEVHDAPTIALKELLELAEYPIADVHENLGVVAKKSKVEPVELPPPIVRTETDTKTETDSSVMTTSTQSAATAYSTTSAANLPATTITEVSASPTSEMPKASSAPPSPTKTDRFENQPSDQPARKTITLYGHHHSDERQRNANLNDDDDNDDDQLDGSNLSNNHETTKPTAPTTSSEIDIEQELRMINELVKGNKNRKQQIKGGIIKLETGSKTESGPTTTAATDDENSIKSTSKTEITAEESRTNLSIMKPTTPIPVKAETTTTSQSTTSTPSTPTTSTPIRIESTSTIWSKIMPFFGLSTAFDALLATTDTTTNKEIIIATTVSPPQMSVSSSSSSSNIEKSSIYNDRSNRNSKIIEISNLSASSFSDRDSQISQEPITTTMSPSTTTKPTKTATTTEIISSKSSNSESRSTISSRSSTTNDPAEEEIDPFSWLPIGWRLDRPTSSTEPSLFLRFWSTNPDNESSSQ